MKKTFVLLVALLVTALAPARLAAGDRFQVSLSVHALFPADSAYREIYGGTVLLPELKTAFSFSRNLYAWAGYGLTLASGETPVLKEAVDSRQGFLAVGAGFRHLAAGGWGLFGELGLASISYREEALGSTVSGSTLGMAVNAGVRRDLGARFFLLAQVGYAYGKKTIEGTAIRLGGAKAGIGAGVRF